MNKDNLQKAIDEYVEEEKQNLIKEIDLEWLSHSYYSYDYRWAYNGYEDLDDDDKDEIDYASKNSNCLESVVILNSDIDDHCGRFQVSINGVLLSFWWYPISFYVIFKTWKYLKSSREQIIQTLREMIRQHDEDFGTPRP